MKFNINLDNGKYEYRFDNGKQIVYRYGDPWRDLCGDNFIYHMAVEIDKLKERLDNHKKFIDDNGLEFNEPKTNWD